MNCFHTLLVWINFIEKFWKFIDLNDYSVKYYVEFNNISTYFTTMDKFERNFININSNRLLILVEKHAIIKVGTSVIKAKSFYRENSSIPFKMHATFIINNSFTYTYITCLYMYTINIYASLQQNIFHSLSFIFIKSSF